MAQRFGFLLLAANAAAVSLRGPESNATALAARVVDTAENATMKVEVNATQKQGGVFDKVRQNCHSVCSFYPDISKCMVGCETELYRCTSINAATPDGKTAYEQCEEKVLEKYRKIHSQIGHFLAMESTQDMHAHCFKVCGGPRGHVQERNCLTDCEVEMYQCADHNVSVPEGKRKYDACAKRVLEHYEEQAGPHTFLAHVVERTELRQHQRAACKDACGADEHDCISDCKVSLYQCADHNQTAPDAKQRYDACEARELAVYRKSGEELHLQAVQARNKREFPRMRATCTAMCRAISAFNACPWTVRCQQDMYKCANQGSQAAMTKCEDGVADQYRSIAQR